MTSRFVYAIYCDDIRFEIGNKRSFIGVYNGQLFVPTFPVTLPKLAISVVVSSPANTPIQSLHIKILKDDTVIAEMPLKEEDISGMKITPLPKEPLSNRSNEEPITLRQNFQCEIILSPFNIEAASTRIRIRVQTESEELKGPALLILVAPEVAASPGGL